MSQGILAASALLAQSSNGGGAGLFAGLGLFMIVIWIIGILATIFWIWMLIDCLTSAMPGTEKILWFLVIFFLHILGALIYFFVKRSSGNRPTLAT